MTIYLVCQNIDLGYHALSAFYKSEEAQKELDTLVAEHYAEGYNWEPQLFIEEITLK